MHCIGEAELEDPFAHETLESLMPRTFQSLSDEHPHQDFDSLLSHLALNKTEKATQEAEAILTCTSKLDIDEIYNIAFPFNKAKSEQRDYLEEMAQDPVVPKENIPPDGNFVIPRIRREGSGRQSTRQPFSTNLRSFGSNLNVQKDLRNIENVDEFFAYAERQETAEALVRKMKGEKSPVTFCSQQLFKPRVRRQGTGRRTLSKNFDVKLPCKYTQSDGELLEVEVEEFPSTFMGSTGQDCSSLMETAHESRNEECLAEAVNNDFHNLRNIRAESNSQNIMQANDQLKIRLSETEETVNMPPKNLFSFENSVQSALLRLVKDYMNEDRENKTQAPFSTSGAGVPGSGKCTKVTEHDIQYTLLQTESSNIVHKQSSHADEISGFGMRDSGNPYPNDLQHDMQNALPHSQTESSDTIHKQSLCADEVKTNMQPHQILRNSTLAVLDRTPFEDFCQKAKETCSPLTSPTPPSRLSAAFKLRRKRTSIVEGNSTDACVPPIQNRDEEMADDYTSSPSQPSRKSKLPKKGQVLSEFSSTFKAQREQENAVEGKSVDACRPPTHNRDDELAMCDTISPSHVLRKSSLLKQGESCGIRRLTFDSPSNSTKKDECNNAEGLNDVEGINLINPLECYDKNEKVEMARPNVVSQNITLSNSQKAAEVEGTEIYNCNALASGPGHYSTEKSVLVPASGQQIEKLPMTLQNKQRKKTKRQSKNKENKGGCDGNEEDKTTSKEVVIVNREKKNKRSDYQRRQSLAGAGTLWKSGVRRSTRIRSRPLEYWRGERFLYGRIHNTLTTVIGIKYSSPDPAIEKKKAPSFKVKSYVDDQYSHMVEYAALY